MKTAFQYDVFISYSHYDDEWVWNWLVPRLKQEDLRMCIDRECFEPGAPSVTEMERAVKTSRKTALVLTPDYLASEWAEFENLMLQTLDPAARQRRLLPLVLKKCELPLRIRFLTHLDFTCEDERGFQFQRLVAAIRGEPMPEQKGAPLRRSALKPYLAHPYPTPKHWTGRQAEMGQLDAWLKDNDSPPMCCLVAIGGMGKSSLAWAWLQRRVVSEQEALGLSGIFQWSFYEGEVSFQRFLEDLSAYLGVSAVSDPVTALTQRLSEQRVLLVLDGFERLLCAYAAADAALLPERTAEELGPGERRCIEWPTVRFLHSLVAGDASKTLLISRFVPEELDRLAGWLLMELTGLNPADAVAYLRTSGVKGTSRELRDTAAVYGFHPLSLSKLVEVLHYDIHQPDDVRQAPRYDVTADLKARQHHILERAYETLPHELAQFLSALAALRGKASMEVARFLAGDWSDAELSVSLRRLEEDRWVMWDREQQTLDFHPIVRRYVYGRLEDKLGTHARLVNYFRPLADRVDTGAAESVADLAPVIELYHHTVRTGHYDEAVRLFHDRLNEPLYYRFGVHQTRIELMCALFTDGEDKPPQLKEEAWQTWTLNGLANSYCLSGQSRRAVSLFKMSNEVDEKRGGKEGVATGLANLSTQQIILGDLVAAEQSLQHSIELCREIGDELREAFGHEELGRLLAYHGAFREAEGEFQAATGSEERENYPFGSLKFGQVSRIVVSSRYDRDAYRD
ncbi:MAG: toll/interleukin-1 receptor domain-containing protein [Anaerolineae bacterium]